MNRQQLQAMIVTQTETEKKPETATASEVAMQSGNASNAPAISNVNTEVQDHSDQQRLSPLSSPLTPITETTVHKHRLSHTPSKLPELRFVDRGLPLPIGPTPPGGPRPHLLLTPILPPPTVANPTTCSVPGPNSIATAPGQAGSLINTTNGQLYPDDEVPSAPSSTQPVPITTPPAPRVSSVLHPVIVTDSNDPGKNHRPYSSEKTSAASRRSLHSTATATASPNHQTSVSQTATTPTGAAKPTTSSTAIRTPANISSALALRSESGTDSSRYYTPATRPRGHRNVSWNTSPTAVRPPGPARRNSFGDPITARSTLASRSPDTATNAVRAQGQPQSTLPKPADLTLPDEQNKVPSRRSSRASRPPVSNRPRPPLAAPGRIAPKRAFPPSGSRRSSYDMYNSSSRYYDNGHEDQTHNPRNRSLRALEGRYSDDRQNDTARQTTEPDDDVAESDNNTADIFMTIAREDAPSSLPRRSDDQQSTESRVVRTPRIPRSRPQSIYSSTIQKPPSPPLVTRRLSEQQIPTSRATRRVPDEPHEQQSNRDAYYQNSAIGRPPLKVDSRGSSRAPSLKPSPITPRTQSELDNSADRNSIFARRPSTRNGDGHARSSSIKQPSGLSKSFNASPSVPKNGVSQQIPNGQSVEASESSNSTAAPSTVWDELDELKSRIHRLELTGKLPKTSSAAISRNPEDRPPTADTGATTLSGSPRRAQTEVVSLASSQKKTQSSLRYILSKTKPFVSSDVYDAIEAAASDALSLSQLMGTAGQSGPISSGASTIGQGGPSTVTDRQLRKKADSICRSLTELCIALKEEDPERKTTSVSRPQTRGTSRSGREEAPRSPNMKVFKGSGPDEPLTSIEDYGSPRAIRLDKRATFNFTGGSGTTSMPTTRYASSVIGGGDDDHTMTGRQSSLVLARARRGVTEEPDDNGRKTTLLRTRRAASEEPEEQESSRRSSMVFAPRRVTTIGRVSNIDEEPQMQSRAPSRAVTEVSNARTEVGNGLRINVPTRDTIARRAMLQEPASASAALPRPRLITSGLPTPGLYSSRMMTPTTPGGRRFLQVNRQQAQEDNNTSNITGRLAGERGQRYSIGGPTASGVTREPSLHRKRHSGIPNISGTASNVGGYR